MLTLLIPLEDSLQVGIDDSSLKLQRKQDDDYKQLVEDQKVLQDFIFYGANPADPHYLPVNLNCITQNALQMFYIYHWKPSDLEPAYICDLVKELSQHLVVAQWDDQLSQEAQENATLRFWMHLWATFTSCCVLEKLYLNREAFKWVMGEIETKFNQSLLNLGEMCSTLACCPVHWRTRHTDDIELIPLCWCF